MSVRHLENIALSTMVVKILFEVILIEILPNSAATYRSFL